MASMMRVLVVSLALAVGCEASVEPGARDVPVTQEAWRVTPSLYPVKAAEPGKGDVVLVVAEDGGLQLDGRRVDGDGLVKALGRASGVKEMLWVRGAVPEPEALMGWLRAASDAGFKGFGVLVWGEPRGGSGERAYGRVHRFAGVESGAGLSVRIAPRLAEVHVDGCEAGLEWCQRTSTGVVEGRIKAHNGVSLFEGLRRAAPHWRRSAQACVEVVVLEAVSVEHLLNATAIAGSVPVSGQRGQVSQMPADRAALHKALGSMGASAHCVRVRLPR